MLKFEMTDAGGSYDWMLENLDASEAGNMLDFEMHKWIDNQISIAREQLVPQIYATAESTSYPTFGYTTAQVLENEDAYIRFKTEEMNETLDAERENMFQHFKTWQQEHKGKSTMKEIDRLTEKTKAVIDARNAAQETRERQALVLLAHPVHPDVTAVNESVKKQKEVLQTAEATLRTQTAIFSQTPDAVLPYGLKVRKMRDVRYTSHQAAFDWCLHYAPCFLEIADARFNKAILEGIIAPDVCEITETVTGTIPAKLEIKADKE